MKNHIVAGSGHRPEKLIQRFPDFPAASLHDRLTDFAADLLTEIEPTEVISGMARGWDLALASAAVRLDIPLTAACPFKGQERLWSGREQALYRDLLTAAARVVFVCNHSLTIAFQERNEWMVDRCDRLLALYNGTHGGTANCIAYANRWPFCTIDNRWRQWIERCAA